MTLVYVPLQTIKNVNRSLLIYCLSTCLITSEETTVSIVIIHEGVKTFIRSRLKLSLGKMTFRYSGAILLNSALPETYKPAASLKAFKRLVMKQDFA